MKKTIDLTISTSAQGSGFEDTQRKLHRLRNSFSSTTSNIAKGVMTQMANIKAAWDMGIGAIRSVASVFAKAIGEAFKFEKAVTDFKVLLGNIDAAKQHINDLRTFAASTPLTFGDLSQASKLLLSFGSSVEDVMPSLRTLGDIALGDAQRFQGLALVFAQVKSQGKLMGQDLLQMVNQGFNPLTVISKETGKSMSELKDMMSEGKISFEMVAEAMRLATSEGGLFHNAMQESSRTGEGMISTLSDNWTDAVRTFGEAFSDAAKNGVGSLSEMLQRLVKDGSIERWAANTAKDLASVAKTVGWVVDKWRKAGIILGTGAAFVRGGTSGALDYWNRTVEEPKALEEEARRERVAKKSATSAKKDTGGLKSSKSLDEMMAEATAEEEAKAAKAAKKAADAKAREEARAAREAERARKAAAAKKEREEREANRKRLQEEKKALQERIKALQTANERELAILDAKIEAERMKADEWERNALGMREAAKGGGRGFSDFIRGRRDAEKEEQKENRMREMAIRRARDQMENIEERARRRPLGRLTADEKRRWQEAKQFIDAQDARNNPALKAAEALEKKRAAAVDNVRKAIEKIEKVIETKVAI